MIIYPNAALNFLFLIFLLFPFTNSLTHNKKEHTLRFTEEKFLMDDIAKAEHNTLINNYLSTKYLYWNKGIRGQGIKIGIFDSGVNNSYIKCNIKSINKKSTISRIYTRKNIFERRLMFYIILRN